MNNLESAEKKRKRLLEIIAIIIVLCIFLVLVFAANLGEGDGLSEDGSITTSVDTNDDEEQEKIEVKGDKTRATVAPGGNFTIALDSEGNVWSWGQNDKGQLGNGTLNDSVSKQPVLLEETDRNGNHIQLFNVVQVAAGEFHAVALTADGKVYMWGYNYYGQAGSVTKRTELYPQLIDTPNNVTIKEIGAGRDYTVMLTTSGKVLGIGDSTYGQLGYNNSLKFTSIREIEENKSEKELPIIEKVSAGTIHVVALDSNGQVWQWGCDGTNAFDFTSIHQITLNGLEAGEKIQEIETGVGGRTMALSSNGKVYTWELGDAGPIEPMNLDNVQVRTDKEKDNIAIVNSTYYVISTDNKVYSWGINNYGQVGVGNTNSPINVPTELIIDEAVKNKDVDKVSSSSVGLDYHLPTEYAINTEGYVLGWGYAGTDIVDPSYTDGSNNFKLLGDGTRYTANYIGSISVKNIVGDDIVLDITAQGLQAGKDSKNVLDVLDNGGYVTGGRVNLYNSSISENSKDSLTIKSVDETIASYDEKTGILVGKQQGRTLVEVVTSKNTIYLNVEVIGDNVAFAKVETKDNFTVALKADGTVWAWGYNSNLGIIDSEHSNYTGIIVPTQVKGLENVKDIAVGTNFVLVLKTDGTVWAWGANNYGQLGNGTIDTSSYASILTTEPKLTQVKRYQLDKVTTDEKITMPTPTVKDDSGENVIYAYTENGVEKECYLNDAKDTYTDINGNIVIKKDTDGILYKWENGAFKTQPVTRDVLGNYKLENITSISAGENYSLALDSNGKVWSWGYNGHRELGLGNTTSNETRAKEVNLSNLSNEESIKQIEAGKYTSYILTNVGNVYAFGYNGNHQCATAGNFYIPTKASALNKIIKISTSVAGNGSAFALTVNGQVYAFGYGYNYPTMLGLDKVVDISGASGNNGAIAKFSDGTIGYWTSGNVNNATITKLKAEDGADFNNVMLIDAGSNYYTVVKSDGTVWTVGSNSSYGQLGNRTTLSTAIPTLKCISYPYLTLDKNEVTLGIGQTSNINAKYSYGFNLLNTEKDIDVTYTSKDENIATVSGNTILAKQAGTTYVTVENQDTGAKLRVKVNVLANDEVTMPNISVGYTHTVAVKTDGTVWGWGQNSYGELGQTSNNPVKTPEKLAIDVKVKDVAAGLNETLMVTEDGKVLAMGYNNYGLGDNANTTSNKPVIVKTQVVDENGNVSYVDLENIVKVTTFDNINLALDNTGKLYAWGYNGSGYAKVVNTFGLEVRDISERLILTEDGKVWEYDNSNRITFKDGLENIVQVSSSAYSKNATYGYYMALDAEGNVYTWAKNNNSTNLVSGTETTIPTKVTFAEGVNIVDIEAGVRVAYAKDELGNVYTWGRSAIAGTLGLGSSIGSVTAPTKIETLANIEVMAASKYSSSYNRTFVSTNIGTVYGFGRNSNYSLLGNIDTTSYYYEPVQVGQSYLGFIDENGNEITRVSIEKGKTATVETSMIDSFNIRNRKSSSTDSNCTWRVINSDLLSILGGDRKENTITANNILGEAVVIAEEIDEEGNKTGVYAKLYVDVVETATLVTPKMESVGNHTIALKADGTVWAWGNNVNYGNSGTIVEPTQVRIAKQVEVVEPQAKTNTDGTPKVDDNGTQIYAYMNNGVEVECYKVGNNYTDLSGKFVIRQDSKDNKLYAWDAEQNKFALEDLVDQNGEKIVVVDIATSNNHTLLLTNTGDVYSFGYNYYGQLGYSTSSNYSYLPIKVTDLRDIVKIAVGDNYSLAMDKYGTLWAFGYQRYYKNRVYHTSINTTVPKQITKLENVDLSENLKNAIDITNEYIVTKDGKVFTIGLYNKTLTAGQQVPGITGSVIKATRTSSSGNGHTAFLTEDGEVFTIGRGTSGQLGNDIYSNSNNTAVQVLYGEENSKLTNIRDINVGENHTMAIGKDGTLYTWGYNGSGELRNSTVEAGVNTARAFEVKSDEKIKDIILVSGGDGFTVVADSTGYAFAWGRGEIGQLGNRLAITSYNAVRVGTEGATLSTNHITLQENGDSVKVTGVSKLLNVLYEQGIDVESATSNDISITTTVVNKDTDEITIRPVKAGTASVTVRTKSAMGKDFENIIQVTVLPEVAEIADDIKLPADRIIMPMTVSGKAHTLILKSDGTVWAYGDNRYGQTGAKVNYSDKATKVEFPVGTASIIAIAAGDEFSVALDAGGNVWTWGYNANGRLGTGTADSSVHAEPTKVLSNIVKIDAGLSEVIALDKNGYAYTWGKNNGGSLGIIGTNADQYSPVRINNIAGIIDVAAGEYHAMILTSDGTVYTTGRNTSGQLGRDVQKSEYFEKVELGAKIAYIEAGNRSSAAIDVSGRLWVWGENSNGQLGLGINDNRVNEPRLVTTIKEIVQNASIGENHIHVVTNTGRLYVAGSNNRGQLGIGKSIDKINTFRQVTSLGTSVMNSNAGTTYSTVIKKDGTVFGFGDYDITRTNFTDSYEPVMITNTTLYLDEQEVVVNIDGTHTINANGQYKLNVLRKDNSDLTYSTANKDIATVDNSGVITGVSVGTTIINVEDKNEGKTKSVIVKVIPKDAVQAPAIEGGDKFTIVTNASGESYSFGTNDNIAKTNIPSLLNNSLSFNRIKAGRDFVVGINKDKTVWVLGDNTNHQLGLEGIDATDKMTVLNTNNINNLVQIDAGETQVIALDEFGIVYVWGDTVEIPTAIRPVNNRVISVSAGGNYSAIADIEGNAYILSNGIAAKINGIENAIKVATGSEYTMVLTSEGTVYKVLNLAPTVYSELTGLGKVVDISVNSDSFMCLNSDKELYTFGNNANGQLGLESANNKVNNPRKAAEDVFTMGAGYNNTYYINTNGDVLSAGLNTSGELGNGTSAKIDAITYKSSNKYVKVGDQEFELDPKAVRVAPDWKVLVGEKDLKDRAEKEEKTKASTIKEKSNFNVFGNGTFDLDKYEFEISNTQIAEITDEKVLEITAKNLGKTVLKITNKVTKEEKELTIKVVTEDLLRIENMFINDTLQDFIAEPDENVDNKFVVNVEGSNPTGTLNIELEFNDTVQVEDEDGNILTATFNSDKNIWQVEGLDLTKSVQELKITLTADDGSKYEFILLIYNELIVKVNDVMLSAKDVLNKETLKTEKVFTKYVDPKSNTAKVEISIDNIENKIQLETTDGTVIKTTNPGEVFEMADLSLPNVDNRFIVKILNANGKAEKQYVLRISKSSIEAIKIKDMSEIKTTDRVLGEDGSVYLQEFNAQILDKNKLANITIELENKDIAKIEIDGVDKTSDISNSKLVISKELEEDESKTTDVVVKVTTNEGYTEDYIIKVSTISSNNNIDVIKLIDIGGISRDPIVESREVPGNILEIVLHDKTAELDKTIGIIPLTESKKATISFNGGLTFMKQGRDVGLEPKKVTDNKYEVPVIVKAENGDTKAYTLYIYKESENTEIEVLKVTGTPSNYESTATRTKGTNNYIGKVVKTDTGYTLSIDLVDEYSVIESITVNDEELTGLTGSQGKYTIDIDSDKVGETIKIKVKAEYGNTDTYALVLKEMDDNAEFDSVKIDATIYNELETVTEINAKVKSTEDGKLTVKAESEYATVRVYEADPRIDNTVKPIAEGTEEVELTIPFNGARTKTLYLEVTSEDGQNKTIKVLNATKTTDNTNVTSVTVDGDLATLDAKDASKTTYTIDVSESTTNATIVVTAEDANSTVQIDSASGKGKVEITTDISNANEVKFTVTSEEGTKKNYTLKLNKLSADTSFTKELQNSEGGVVASNSEFVQDATDKLKYKVEVLDNLGDIKLVIKPNDSKTTVVIKDKDGNVIPNGVIPSDISQDITVEMTSEDGNTTTYTIQVVSKHHMIQSASVTGNTTNAKTISLTAEDIAKLYKVVRVHPDSTQASIYVEVNSSYSLTGVNANVAYIDKDGNPLHDDLKDEDITASVTGTVSSNRSSTFNVNLLSEKATVQVTLTISTGETQVLTLDIVKGSTEAKLNYVELVGSTLGEKKKATYGDADTTKEIVMTSKDSKFTMEAVAKNNGTVKIYKLEDPEQDFQTVDLATLTEITNKSEVTLSTEDSLYVIEVTSEFDNNKARYLVNTRKQHSDASLVNLTLTVGNAEKGDTVKHLGDFGKFTYDKATDTYKLTAGVPEKMDSLTISELVADSKAKIEWTDIGGTEYAEYKDKDIKELSQADLIGNIEKHIKIKVTAENGTVKNYDITLKTINPNMTVGDITLYNVTDQKNVDIENKNDKNKTAKILQSVNDVTVKGIATNGAVSLKVLSINGHKINEEVATDPEFVMNENALDISVVGPYTYIDEEGNTQTISGDEIQTIVVERQVKSEGKHLYPAYYEDEEIKTDTLTITKLMTDANIKVTYLDDGTPNTITSTNFGGVKVDKDTGDKVREATVYLASAQTSVVINNITADNKHVKVSHRGNGDTYTLYKAAAPYTRDFSVDDKATITEEIEVTTDVEENDITYRIKFVKKSANNNINTVTVNTDQAQKVADRDEFTHAILSSTNKLEVGITDIEKNATVKMYISAINNIGVTTSDKAVTYSDVREKEELKDATKDLYAQLLNALTQTNIERKDLNKITVKIEVQAEDSDVTLRTYTLNIEVQNSNLVSINGIDLNGNIKKTSQLLGGDFSVGSNPYKTPIIKVASSVSTVELTDITCTGDETAILTDGLGNVLKNKSLTVNVSDTGVTEAKIIVTLNGVKQEFVVRIQKKSTDVAIKEISADLDKTSATSQTTGSYELNVRSTVDPEVKVTLNDTGAKVKKAVSNVAGVNVSTIKNNTFTVSGIAEGTHKDPSAIAKQIGITITVEAEDGNTQDYVIMLNRKHTETGLGVVAVEESFVGDNVPPINFTNVSTINRTISSSTNGITIKKAQAKCNLAKVYVLNDAGEKREIGETGLHIDITAGTNKSIKLLVIAEYGNERTYILNVRRQSANTNLSGVTVTSGGEVKQDTVKPYEIDINVNNNPAIVIAPSDSNAKVTGVKVYRQGESSTVNIANISSIVNGTTFSITDLSKLYTDDDTEDASDNLNRYITVEVEITAEDTNVKATHIITLNRRHIETGLQDISYQYEQTVEKEVPVEPTEGETTEGEPTEGETTKVTVTETVEGTAKLSTTETKEIFVSSTTESIAFAKFVPACKEAEKVEITVDGEKVTQTDDGIIVDLAEKVEGNGRIRNIVITVTAESEGTATYTIKVIRMATNASLEKVLVNGNEIEMTEENLPEGISGIFNANVKDSDKQAIIEAMSANPYATVSIADTDYTTMNTEPSYDEKGKYDLSKASGRTVTITIVVTPQDSTKPTKTYQLVLTRIYDSTVLESVSVKPAVDGVKNSDSIVKKDNNTHTLDFAKTASKANDKNVYFKSGRITVDTDWTSVAIGDLLPQDLADTDYIQQYTITRINGEDPYTASKVTDYTIDSEFEMPEGTPVYFKIVTKAESGSEGIYVVEVYKNATNTTLTNIRVDGKLAVLDEDSGIYKVNVSVLKDKLPIVITGQNNLSKDKTKLSSITANGVDITNLLGQSNTGSGKTVQITLRDIVNELNKNKTTCSDLDGLDNKVITVVISVVPEDTSIDAREYTVEITRQHSDETIKNIVLNQGQTIEIEGVETSVEKIVPAGFRYKYYGTESNRYRLYEQEIKVTSKLDTVTINAINLTCEYATGTMIVDGKTYELPLKEPVPVSLPTEGSSKRIEIHTVAEDGTINEDTDPKYIILTRMYSDDSIRNIMVQREYIAVDSDGEPLEDNPRYETYVNDTKVENEETYNIRQNAETTKLTLYANNSLARINMQLVDVLDRDGNSIKTDSDILTLSYVQGRNIYDRLYNIMNTRIAKFNTSNPLARTFVIKVSVKSEDPQVPAEVYTINVVKQDNSAEISKVVEVNDTEIDIPVDTENTHYEYIGSELDDGNIYTKYITSDIEEVVTKVYAESKFAKVELFNTDPREDTSAEAFATGTGTVIGNIATTEGWTRVFVKITAEDRLTNNIYEVWFIKKSETDDVSIKELYVDGEAIPAREDGNYEIEIPDTLTEITVKMIPNYEFANVSINGQPFTWQEAEEIINEYTLKGENVEIKLQVNIPEQQSTSGKAINNTKFLYIHRVSTSNEIEEITTDNNRDSITPGGSPQFNDATGINDTYVVNLYGDREFVDLRIVPVSLGATLTLYDLDGNELTSSKGTLFYENIEVNSEDTITFKVKVAPEQGEAKEYYINIVPKASQAELMQIIVDSNIIDVTPGVYEYPVYDLTLPEIGAIEAIAEDSQALVNIYTKEHPAGIGDTLGSAIVSDVNFEQAIIVQITVMSPNRKNQNTYKLYFKDVSDDTTLKEVSYNTTGNEADKVIVEMTESSDPSFAGEYIIKLEPDAQTINIGMIANAELTTIAVEELEKEHSLELSKDVSSMTEDIVIYVLTTAESDSQSVYKVIIKKPMSITGKVVTENDSGNYSNVLVQILDSANVEIATTLTNSDGTFEVSVPEGEGYSVVIKKPGYLRYTITDIPVVYGVRTYVGIANLIAGEVAGNDEHIELRDMVQLNKKVRNAGSVEADSPDKIYDFDENGYIEQKDLAILLKNYDKTAQKDSTFTYTRYINVKGLVIDKTGAIVQDATIELGNRATTSKSGEFDVEDIKVGDYTLTVKDSNGNIIGQNDISIVEGNEYTIKDNTITIAANTSVVDLQVIVNGTKAIISKRGEESDIDMIEPKATMEENAVEFVDDEIKVIVTGEDQNLSSFELYTTDENGENATLIASKTVSGVKSYTTTLEGKVETEFNKLHYIKVVVRDKSGNATELSSKVTDNTIRTEEDLVTFSNIVNGQNGETRKKYTKETVTLGRDLDLSTTRFNPIGMSGLKVFEGTFDGKGHTISNINIDSTNNYVGLFGYVKNATIKNVGIESGSINSSKNSVGGIVGYAIGTTTIENCYNKANISGTSKVGGIIGSSDDTITIENCYNAGNVTGTSKVGGIVGELNKGKINKCYNIGTIEGTSIAGGIAGFQKVTLENDNVKTAQITNSYYSNTVGKGIGEIGTVEGSEIIDTTEAITDVDTLLTNLGDAFKADLDGINKNYPILVWEKQAEPEVAVMKLSKPVASEYILPVTTDYTITSEFGVRVHPVTGETSKMHYGIDIAAEWKSEVIAIEEGTVTFAGENGGYGYCIEIEHEINGEKVYSVYAHLFRIDVEVGDTVTKGQTIGKVGGMPGTEGAGTSTGPHLHLEIRKQSGSYASAVDPRNYLEF